MPAPKARGQGDTAGAGAREGGAGGGGRSQGGTGPVEEAGQRALHYLVYYNSGLY